MPLLVLALATLPTAQADPSPPLPPLGVQATATGGGTLVSWTPPPAAGDAPVLAYHVLRLDAAARGWHEVGAVDGSEASFLDAMPFAGVAAYSVTAQTADGPSAMSAPAVASPTCSAVVVSGIPPQVGVNWDCLLWPGQLMGDGSPAMRCEPAWASGPAIGIGTGCSPLDAAGGIDPLAVGACSIVGLSGTPPQPIVNTDCIWTPIHWPPLLVRG